MAALEVAFILIVAVLVIAGIVVIAAFFIRKKYYKPHRLEREIVIIVASLHQDFYIQAKI